MAAPPAHIEMASTKIRRNADVIFTAVDNCRSDLDSYTANIIHLCEEPSTLLLADRWLRIANQRDMARPAHQAIGLIHDRLVELGVLRPDDPRHSW